VFYYFKKNGDKDQRKIGPKNIFAPKITPFPTNYTNK
jgi:hypothetical protein